VLKIGNRYYKSIWSFIVVKFFKRSVLSLPDGIEVVPPALLSDDTFKIDNISLDEIKNQITVDCRILCADTKSCGIENVIVHLDRMGI
jgi:hypothetical protein